MIHSVSDHWAVRGPAYLARLGVSLLLALCLSLVASPAMAAPAVEMVSPKPDSLLIGRRPVIRCTLAADLPRKGLLVVLDDIDISAVIKLTADGFTYQPAKTLDPGKHTLVVRYKATGQDETERKFFFTLRHSKAFREVHGEGELTAIYQGKLQANESEGGEPGSQFETNLGSEVRVKEGGWDLGFQFNLRYLDQSRPMDEPLSKGLNMADYLLDIKYTQGGFGFVSRLGDIIIEESENTANGLSSRGGMLGVSYEGLSLAVFSVNSYQYYGFYGGLGVSDDTDEHIHGASAGLALFDEAVKLKVIYLTGGENLAQGGDYDSGDARKGEVWGIQLSTDFFQERLRTDFELDFSKYDPETSDDIAAYDDRAWRVGAEGNWGRYFYSARYQYFGTDYAVVGNSSVENNRSGWMVIGGAEYDAHTFSAGYTRFRDNVADDGAQPVNYVEEGSLEYSYTGLEYLQAAIAYVRSIIHSTAEPEDTERINTHAHTLTLTTALLGNPWGLEFTAGYSHQYDRHDDAGNSVVTNFSLAPSFTSEVCTVVPSVSYDLTNQEAEDLDSQTLAVNLDIRGNLDKLMGFPSGAFSYGLTATYTQVRSSDDSAKNDTISAALELSYLLGENVWPGMKPSIGLRMRYDKIKDYADQSQDEDISVFLVIQTSLPFSF